jgi:D-sedoheptulose 7-phosphate isomerase
MPVNTLDQLFEESSSLVEYARGYLDYLSKLLGQLDLEAIQQVEDAFEHARIRGQTIFLLGNGGSAATASHFAEDLWFGTHVDGKYAYRVVCLADNVPTITALANDMGYENVFVEQLRALFRPGDVLVAISASGNSANVLRAVEYANDHNGKTVGLTGFDGGRLKEICDICLHVPTGVGEYGPVEDIHLIANHLLTTYLARKFAQYSVEQESSPS